MPPTRRSQTKAANVDADVEEEVAAPTANTTKEDYDKGTNFVSGGIEENAFLFALTVCAPFITVLLSYITSKEMHTPAGLYEVTDGDGNADPVEHPSSGMEPHLSVMIPACFEDVAACATNVANAGLSTFPPDFESVRFIAIFMAVAFVLEWLPGKIETGPETGTGHVPKYVDNGVRHSLLYTVLFVAGSNIGPGCAHLYDFGIMYDVFPGALATLNIFGVCFCMFLTYKGLHFPSTADSGSSGSAITDYLWGTELYPRIGNWDLKRFINCRFSMTFWQLAGLSFAYRSFTLHGAIDYGLLLSAVSQYLYLFKFFWWEMGYMRSIDIIVDRAGFEIQWGCLCWVPAVYTFHTRYCVLHPTGLSLVAALALFVVSLAGVVLNYAADRERDVFRATNGAGYAEKDFIRADYEVVDVKTGKKKKKNSLLLAAGYWGMARHLQYLFELTAAWSWCLLANPLVNGCLPLVYAVFLTYLLIDRAERDSKKCHLKYGVHYEEYCRRVPYKIVPGLF